MIRIKDNNFNAIFAGLFASLLFTGLALLYMSFFFSRRDLQQELMAEAQRIAISAPTDEVINITQPKARAGIENWLRTIELLYPSYSNVYLLKPDTSHFIYIDSRSLASKTYDGPTDPIYKTIQTHQPLFIKEAPQTDRWASIFVPVYTNQKLIAVIGIDTDKQIWDRHLHRYSLFSGVMIVSLIVFAAFVFIAMKLLRRWQTSYHLVEALSRKDPLTGLYNRRYIDEIFEETILHHTQFEQGFAILYLDINSLKPVNDQFGHKGGDLLIKAVANRLQHSLRSSDHIGRIGGDEFIIILEGVANVENIQILISKLLLNLSEPFHKDQFHLANTSCSIGYAMFPEDGALAEQLIAAADKRMYEQKQAFHSNRTSEIAQLSNF